MGSGNFHSSNVHECVAAPSHSGAQRLVIPSHGIEFRKEMYCWPIHDLASSLVNALKSTGLTK